MSDGDVSDDVDDDVIVRARQCVDVPVERVVPVAVTCITVPIHIDIGDLCCYRTDVALKTVVVLRPGEEDVITRWQPNGRGRDAPAIAAVGVGTQQNVTADQQCAVAIGVPIESNGFDRSVRIGYTVGRQR